ncbi:hypothetical protein QZH41_009397 [Actinostola sp. cb2023]|nr:hypothetical protein QZH41_009397 [Actinostola sp. cb2023]
MEPTRSVAVPSIPDNDLLNGVQGHALRMDGTTNVTLANYEGTCLFQNTSTGLTISLWMKYGNKTGGDSQTFFTLGDNADGGARLQIDQPNTTVEEVGVLSNVRGRRLFIRFSCPWNIWTHILVTWDGVTSSIIVYRNAVPVDDVYYDICFGCINDTHAYSAHLGGIDNAQAPNGSFDEIAMWCRELNYTEVQEVYRYYKAIVNKRSCYVQIDSTRGLIRTQEKC